MLSSTTNMQEKKLSIDKIGPVVFRRSSRAKHVNITCKPFKPVVVTVPEGVTFNEAEQIVRQRTDWIIEHQARMKEAEQAFTIYEEGNDYRTRHHIMVTERQDRNNVKVNVSKGTIKVLIPSGMDFMDTSIQDAIRSGMIRAWRNEAKEYLPGFVQELAEEHGFEYNIVVIKNMLTRWGSYSSQTGNLNLSLHLMRLPDHLIRYVVLHELTHTKIGPHNRQFWMRLDQVLGTGSRKVEAELKGHRLGLY
jgi:predicted metal-dependent hydrolase